MVQINYFSSENELLLYKRLWICFTIIILFSPFKFHKEIFLKFSLWTTGGVTEDKAHKSMSFSLLSKPTLDHTLMTCDNYIESVPASLRLEYCFPSGKQISVMTLWIDFSIQFSEWWFALQPHFSDGSKNSQIFFYFHKVSPDIQKVSSHIAWKKK